MKVKNDRQGVGGSEEKGLGKKTKTIGGRVKSDEKERKEVQKKTKSRMLISQQLVYNRVWAKGHASAGQHEGKQDKRRVKGNWYVIKVMNDKNRGGDTFPRFARTKEVPSFLIGL